MAGVPSPVGRTRHVSTSRRAQSTEMYASRWKNRSLRTRSRLIRLAVRLAMHPDAKRSRTLAMSTCPVSTGTPTASIAATSSPTAVRTMSRSWIIRSKTTSTSRLRGEKAPMRCTSMKRGASTSGRATVTAGL